MSMRGFTLVELLVAMVVMLLLLEGSLGFAHNTLPAMRLTSDANQVIGLLGQARSHALGHEPVLVCALDSHCDKFPDSNGLMLVVDSNGNQRHDPDEPVLAIARLHPDTRLSWNSFRKQPNLSYLQGGTAYFQNGNLLLCHQGRASKVIVNWIGKPRVEKVSDADACRKA